MSYLRIMIVSAILSLLGACAEVDSVLFVTGTQIGIDADSRPPNVSIGYDRDETIIGPNYESETGAIPSVVGRLESDLAVFNPSIRQVYATGNAARLVTTNPPEKGDLSEFRPLAEKEEKSLMFFRTGTNVGRKLTFAETLPESLSFGYKRKEMSFVPLVEVVDADEQSKEIYGSVLASIGVNVRTPSLSETALGVSQFFATGIAAERLARDNEEIRERFKNIAREALQVYEREVGRQERQAVDALVCYQAIPTSRRPQVWESAAALDLLGNDPDQLSKLKQEYETALAAEPEEAREKQVAEVNRKYGMLIGVARGAEANRAALLERHADFVCDLRNKIVNET